MSAARSLARLLFACLAGAGSPAFAADQVVDDCSNDTELRADLTAMQESDGGILTFSCDTATIVLTADLPVLSRVTEIDGGGKITISGAGARQIFVVTASGGLVLSNMVLTSGASAGDGGAIYAEGGVVLDNVIIRDSVAALSGGAIYAEGGVVLDNVIIRDSVAALSGGAIYSITGAVIENSELHSNEAAQGGAVSVGGSGAVVRKTWIHDNEATGASEGWGGGVYLFDEADIVIEDSTLSGNSAKNCGAGMFTRSVDAGFVLARTRIVENICESGDGAGLHVEGGSFVMNESEISSNETPGNGGGLSFTDGEAAAIDNSTLANNSSGGVGGGMLVTNTAFVLENVTISSNDAQSAGGLRIENTTAVLARVTVASNEGGGAGALDYFADSDVDLVFSSLLLADNEEQNLALAGSSGAQIVSGGGNVSDDDSGSAILTLVSDTRSAHTLLGPLRLNGGLTPTHVPQPGSDAVDTGVATTGNDQRGIERPQGPSVDAGAVEVVPCGDITAICGDANDNDTISSSDALKALRTAVDVDECALWFCDYDGNGSVSSVDALGILRESVGLPTTPSCPPVWDCHSL